MEVISWINCRRVNLVNYDNESGGYVKFSLRNTSVDRSPNSQIFYYRKKSVQSSYNFPHSMFVA